MFDQILEKLKPKEQLESIYQIDFKALKHQGIKGLVLDIDDTLLPRQMLEISHVLLSFIEKLKDIGFSIFLMSNNMNQPRVAYIGKTLNLPFSTFSMKPLPFSFNSACKKMGLSPKEVAVVGDQLFMDILGGNLLGMHTILVSPMSPETLFLRQWMRNAEKWVLEKIESNKLGF